MLVCFVSFPLDFMGIGMGWGGQLIFVFETYLSLLLFKTNITYRETEKGL